MKSKIYKILMGTLSIQVYLKNLRLKIILNSEEILKFTGDKSVSIEVFGDDEKTCYDQAKKIASLSKKYFR